MKNLLLSIIAFGVLLTGLVISPVKEHFPGFWWVMGIALVVLTLNFKKGWKHLIQRWQTEKVETAITIPLTEFDAELKFEKVVRGGYNLEFRGGSKSSGPVLKEEPDHFKGVVKEFNEKAESGEITLYSEKLLAQIMVKKEGKTIVISKKFL